MTDSVTMIKRIQGSYIYSTAVILFVTAVIKFISAFGTAPILDWLDPLMPLTNRHVFILAGALEAGISAFLFLGRELKTKTTLIAWLSIIYSIYRIGLWWAEAPNLCHCLGNLHEWFPISPVIENGVVWALLCWLLAGSNLFIIILWNNKETLKASPAR